MWRDKMIWKGVCEGDISRVLYLMKYKNGCKRSLSLGFVCVECVSVINEKDFLKLKGLFRNGITSCVQERSCLCRNDSKIALDAFFLKSFCPLVPNIKTKKFFKKSVQH